MEVIRIKKILARNLPIGICLHCVRTLSWFVPTMSTLFLVTSENKVTKKPFCMYYYYFWNRFFKSYKILIYLHPVLSKSIHFCIFMIQNSSKVFLYSHILSFLKIFPWNQNFSSYLDCPHYVWNKKVQKVQGDKIDVTIYS